MKKRPFSNGTDFTLWMSKNCDECKISTSFRDSDKFLCHIDEALIIAYFDDGVIDEKIFNKIGQRKDLHFNDCPFKNAYELRKVKINTTVFKHNQLSIW
jgi:hypothetical protein